MHFKHIAIVGVGLIGGSFALAARRARLAERITGWDSKEALDKALEIGVIDGIEDGFDSGNACEADLVYLAAPVGAIVRFIRERGQSLKPGVIVTDAGSTKREICRAALESLPPEVAFVGGHPMSGSERTGVEFANADLFQGAGYALITNPGAVSDALDAITQVVKTIGATPLVMTPEQHDRIAAHVSHSAQMVSTALALAVARRCETGTLELAGSGFAEMTRLAESRWSVWEDICRTNADQISAALDETIAELEAVRAAISGGDLSGLCEMFDSAGSFVRSFRDYRSQTDS
jgi:prephenate dehydrogenase